MPPLDYCQQTQQEESMMSSDQSKAQIGKTQLEIQLSELRLQDYTFLVEITLTTYYFIIIVK